MRLALLLSVLCVFPAMADEVAWKAGAARQAVTPNKPVWMTGYGSRTHVSTGTVAELYVRALALDDGRGRPVVLVGVEVLGFPAAVSAQIAADVQKQYGIPRDRLLLNFSHTHCGPALSHPHRMLYIGATADELRDVDEYTRGLERTVVATVGAALKDLRPARLRFGYGQATFAMNRRKKTERGYVINVNPGGPVDHDVPVLLVESAQGQQIGVVFGYACHNTTVGGDCYEFHGDYAGFAQAQLEKSHPQAVAMFIQGCGADANPDPRGTLDLARRHGATLASEVERTVGGQLRPVGGPVSTAWQVFPVAFAKAPSQDELRTQLQHKDVYRRWQAQELLKMMDRDGRLPASYPYPLQVWQFGQDLTLVAMSGEVVVDYALRLKKELGGSKLWVAGYCNDVFAYIPSRRVLEEGGYEAVDAMIYYVQPGPFAPSIEETIMQKAHELVDKARSVDTK